MNARTVFPLNRFRPRWLVVLCSLWLGFFCLARSALADIEVVVDLYHVAGNLTVAQRDALLADPGWQISAGYAPLLSVPGVTASWSRCGFLSLPCLSNDQETVSLSGEEIRRDGTSLSFRLPGYVGIRRFRLAHVSLKLAKNPYDSLKRPEVGFFVDSKDGTDHAPVVIDGGSFILAGSLKTKGVQFRLISHGSVDSDMFWGQDDRGIYTFMPKHRFAFYRHPYQYPGKEVTWSSTPQEFVGTKLYRASLRSAVVDGHRVESVDIAATQNREDCFSDDLQYAIHYVDGEAIRYMRKVPDTDLAQCQAHFRRMEWDDSGRVLSYDTALTSWVNHGSSVTYTNWAANCVMQASSSFSKCNSPAPGSAIEADIRADARRVRAWFP